MRVEREGNQRWLVVKGRPDQVWPVVKDFWQETGFIVNVELPEAGVMETDWAENRARISDPGLIRGILGKLLDQVYFDQRARQVPHAARARHRAGHDRNLHQPPRHGRSVYRGRRRDQTKWQPRPPDPELEAEMLRRLMMRFGVQEARAKAQVATATDKTPPRATLSKGGEGGTLGAPRAVRPRVAARRSGARPRRVYRGGPRPLEGNLFRALHRSSDRQQAAGIQAGLAVEAEVLGRKRREERRPSSSAFR